MVEFGALRSVDFLLAFAAVLRFFVLTNGSDGRLSSRLDDSAGKMCLVFKGMAVSVKIILLHPAGMITPRSCCTLGENPAFACNLCGIMGLSLFAVRAPACGQLM